MRTRIGVIGACSALLLAGPALAQEGAEIGVNGWLSGNVAVASDYTFRGISQTLEKPAIQGGMDLEHPSGLYLGVWGSNVNFGEDLPRAQLELDVYGGLGYSLGSLFDLDLGFVYYAYPGAASSYDYDFLEFGLGASRETGGVGTGISVKYSPDFFAGSGTGLYYGAELGIPLSIFTLSGSAGRQTIEDNDAFGTPDYTDWSAGLSVGVAGFEIGGRVVGTSLKNGQCFDGMDLCRSRVIFSISRGL